MVMAGLILVTREKKEGSISAGKMPAFYVILSFIAGIACSVQIAVNGTLRLVVQSVSKATLISMSVAILSTLLVMAVLMLVKGRYGIFDQPAGSRVKFKPWMVTGGLFALSIFVTYCPPVSARFKSVGKAVVGIGNIYLTVS